MHPIIHIGPVSIYTYTLTGLLGIFFGILVAVYSDPKDKPIRSDIFYCSLYAMIGGLAGGKILYIITILRKIVEDPSILKYTLSSGMVFYGGLIGGIVGGYLYTRQYKVDFFKMADSITLGLPVGHIFGRLGCFAAGCCYGKPYDGIFAVIYPKESLSAPAGIPLHPVQIYEAVYNVFVFIVLLILKRRSKEGKGLVLWTYLLLYGIGRFYMETLRYDAERGFLWIFSTSQWISIFSIITGITGMIFILSKKRAREESK
ncbi:MAG: prolipoprotein diacylglyceryl transferase [Clostridiaceae bacterium]|nr:prolipoprotein diacylglyceryl transferase [Clostridiaceae bacterium]